jgi:hypothetical protein
LAFLVSGGDFEELSRRAFDGAPLAFQINDPGTEHTGFSIQHLRW